ncbi:unnamed protein product [Heterobilharzia americana]|nr:unnamed protein product [Heterobilharzia americana]
MEDNLHSTGPISPPVGNMHTRHGGNIEHSTTTSTSITTGNNYDTTLMHMNNSREKDLIVTSSLLWLLKRQMAQDSGDTSQNDNTDSTGHLIRLLISQLGRRSRVPTGSFSSRQHLNCLDSNHERSPSCSVRMKYRGNRIDNRLSTTPFDYLTLPHSEGHFFGSQYDRMYERGRNRLPTNRFPHGSYRAPDFAYREYTTICDDIDLSCLSYPNSPIMSPNGSRIDLTCIGHMKNTNVSTDNVVTSKPNENIAVVKRSSIPLTSCENIIDKRVKYITSTNEILSMTTKSAPVTPGETRAILQHSTMDNNNNTLRSHSITTLHSDIKSTDEFTGISSKHHHHHKHHRQHHHQQQQQHDHLHESNPHFTIDPDLYSYGHLLNTDEINDSNLRKILNDLQNYSKHIDHEDEDDDNERDAIIEKERDNEAIEEEEEEEEEEQETRDEEEDEENIQLGLEEAENAERIELQGAMLRRLHKLSKSTITNKSHHLSASLNFAGNNNNSSSNNNNNNNGDNSSTSFHHIQHTNSKCVKRNSNQGISQKVGYWDVS